MKARDTSDRRQALAVLAVIVLAVIATVGLLVAFAIVELPVITRFVDETLSPGLGLRSAAILSAVISFAVLIAFAVASGDGLLGELPFVIAGFFLFFLFFWIMTAWVF